MKLLTKIGIYLTSFWAILLIVVVVTNLEEAKSLQLNAWGDFFAGVTAPIALMWLVIGYFQQAEELRLNTRALETQQEELRKQVEETARLASNSERQAAASEALTTLNKDEADRKAYFERKKAQPILVGDGGSGSSNKVKTKILNKGGVAYNAGITSEEDSELHFSVGRVWESEQSAIITITQHSAQEPIEWPVNFSLHYEDAFGEKHVRQLNFNRPHVLEGETS